MHPAAQRGPRGRAAVLQELMHEGSRGHEGGICHRSGLEHVVARGRDGTPRGSGQMGFIPVHRLAGVACGPSIHLLLHPLLAL